MLNCIQTVMTLTALLITSRVALSGDWPQWRGPNRNGIADLKLSAKALPEELTLGWRAEVGAGRSSPIVANGKVFIHTRTGAQERVSCLTLGDGKTIWRQTNPAPFTKNQYAQSQGEGPFATPTFHDKRVYTLGVNGLLSCFEAESGKLIWRQAFAEQVNTSKLFCGTAMSPIIEDGLCIVHVGDDVEGALIAYDARTGKPQWQWTDQGPGYASPIIINVDEERQLVTLTDEACIGIDPQSGHLLWQFPFPDEWNENIVTPVHHNGLLIISGVRKGTLALKIKRSEESWKTETVWHNTELPMYMSSPVIHNDVLYGLTNKRKGQFFAMNPMSGEAFWRSMGRQGQNAAIVASGPLMVLLSTEGKLVIARGSRASFHPVREYTVAETATWAQPVVTKDGILVKDESSLAFWVFEKSSALGSH